MVWSSTILSCFGYKPPQQYYATLGLNKTHKQSHANWIRLGIKFLSFSIHSSWSLSPVVPPLKVSDTRRKFFSRRKTRPSRSGTRFLCGAVHLGYLCNQATHCHSWPQFLHCLDFLQIFGRVSPRFTITNGNQCLTAKKIHQKRGFAIQSWV